MEEDKVFASLEDAIKTYKERESNALKEYSLACALNQYGEHLFERAEAFKQLVEWLIELKSLKEEKKTAHWKLLDECSNAGVYCSNCHKKVYKEEYANQKMKSKYCPNCGARMNDNKGIDKLIKTLPSKVVEELKSQRDLIRINSSKKYYEAVEDRLTKIATYLMALGDANIINEEQVRQLYEYYTDGAGEKE